MDGIPQSGSYTLSQHVFQIFPTVILRCVTPQKAGDSMNIGIVGAGKVGFSFGRLLAEKGVRNIWFPCIPKEEKLIAEAEDSYACPVVGGYPEALRLALETAAPKTRILTPFVSIEKFSTVARALCEAFPQLKHKDVVRACEKVVTIQRKGRYNAV